MKVITGFHAIEELLRSVDKKKGGENKGEKKTAALPSDSPAAPPNPQLPQLQLQSSLRILYAKQGPRIKKILQQAGSCGIPAEAVTKEQLDSMTAALPEYLQDHRGIILIDNSTQPQQAVQSADALIARLCSAEHAFAVVLDSITDPHNVGAIIRSADQFGVDAVIVPQRHSAGDVQTIGKTSAGASAWVPIIHTVNLVRTVEQLKKSGFWVFGAEAGGSPLTETMFPDKTLLIMGSEGSGISRLLKQSCDSFTAISTHGKLDSLNVSVAAGILMYAVRLQHPKA